MRNRFGSWIAEKVNSRSDIYLLSGDIGFGLFDELIENNPERFINCGIAEQNMIGVSAGLAAQGITPFVYTIIPFLIYRPYEFIRNLVAHQGLKIVLVGVGGGFSYDNLGFTHYAKEDLILAATLPNFKIYTPYDVPSAEYCFNAALENDSASYVRLMKGGEENLPRVKTLPGAEIICDFGDQFTVMTHGSICWQVLGAVEALNVDGIAGKLIAIWDYQNLTEIMQHARGSIIFVEEHISPGLLMPHFWEKTNGTKDVYFFGISKNCDNHVGSREEILTQHGLDSRSLYLKIKSKIQGHSV